MNDFIFPKIESHIPIPTGTTKNRRPSLNWKPFLLKLKVGDSFQTTYPTLLSYCNNQLGGAIRLTRMENNGLYRYWRIH